MVKLTDLTAPLVETIEEASRLTGTVGNPFPAVGGLLLLLLTITKIGPSSVREAGCKKYWSISTFFYLGKLKEEQK